MTLLVPADLGSATLSGWLTAITKADAAPGAWPMVLLAAADPVDPLDGLALAAFCASRTRRIRLCAAIDPDTVEPFTLARGLATLDHLSKGRAAWHLAAGGNPARSAELAEVVARLLTSWAADALVADPAAGMLSRPDSAGPIAHEGTFFHVRGPLNVPRPPQGAVPRIALAGEANAPGIETIAEVARLTLDQVLEALA